MHIHINPAAEHLRSFSEHLPEQFDAGGEALHTGRNTIKAFEVGGEQLAVKRFRRPNLLRALIYTFRRSKARRSYEHAMRLRALGVDSPEPIAWIEYRRRGLLSDSFYVSRRSDYTPLSQTTEHFPSAGTLPVLEAFARFAAQLHERGIEHRDFNHGNVLWDRDAATGALRFQLIDINRMHFADRPLRPRVCMVNLRRLSCPAVAFLYILDRYAEARGWNVNDTLLQGTFFRLAFGRQKELRKRFRRRKG